MSHPSEVRKKLSVEMYGGGMSPREIAQGLASAVGHLLLCQSPGSESAESLAEADEAFRTRDLRQEPVASLVIETVDEPLRGWRQKPGVRWGWAIGEDGRKVFRSRSTAQSESGESGREVFRDLGKRGLRPAATSTTAGARGLSPALEAGWPKSLRIRGWCHKRQTLQQKVPAQAWPEGKALRVEMREAPSQEKAEPRREASGARYQRAFPEWCRWLLDEAAASLKHLAVPKRHPPYVRTANRVERAFVAARRRPTVLPPLWAEGRLGH